MAERELRRKSRRASGAPCRDRTCDPLIKSPKTDCQKPIDCKDLGNGESGRVADGVADGSPRVSSHANGSPVDGEADFELEAVLQAWPKLSEAGRQAVLAVIRAASQ